MKSDLPYLGHIADSIAAIEAYVSGGRDVYLQDRLIQDAVIRNFEVIGEAARRLSATTRAAASRVPAAWVQSACGAALSSAIASN